MITKPCTSEYAPFAGTYVAYSAESENILELLSSSLEHTTALFKSIDAEKEEYSYAPGKWTIREVLSHMADTERVFAYRALAISRGEQQPLPGFDQDTYVLNSDANKRPLAELIEEFRAVRLSTLLFFRAVSDEQSLRLGMASSHPVSVRALAYMIAGHELHHMKIMEERYV